GLKPATYIERNRYELAAAAITLIRGYLQSDAHSKGGLAKDRLSSFENWDTVARQPVLWLSTQVEGLADPKRSIDDNMEKDPEHETLSELLAWIYKWRSNIIFNARELYDQAIRSAMTDNDLQEILLDLNG